MKRLACAVVAGTLAIGYAAAAQDRRDRITVPLSDPARPVVLDIDLYAGIVDVNASEGNAVIIEATTVVARRARQAVQQRRGSRAADTSGLTRLPQGTALDVEERDNTVSVTGPGGQRIDLTIQVPLRTSLRLRKSAPGSPASPGTIAVRGLEGDLEIHTEAGAITLSDVAGSVVAHSTHGSVNARVRRVTPDRPMAFTSYGGDVDVTLPPTVNANFILLSERGDVFTDFALQTRNSSVQAERRPGGGFIRKGGAPVRASANGGGAEFELQSYSGHVYLRKGQ
jgi:hypothetical protein